VVSASDPHGRILGSLERGDFASKGGKTFDFLIRKIWKSEHCLKAAELLVVKGVTVM
jgi:hypothetical protein